MACSKCKKQEMRELMEKEALKMEKWALVTVIVVIGAAVYGLVSLICKFI
jgi:uncharacterized membrane protein